MKSQAIVFFRTIYGTRVTITPDHLSSYEEVRFFYLFNHVKIIMNNGTVYRINDTYENISKIVDPILKS